MKIVFKNSTVKSFLEEFKHMSISEIALFFLTLLIWVDRILLSYADAVLMRLPIIGSLSDYIIAAIYVILIPLALPKIFENVRASDIILGFIVIIVCLLNLVVFPSNSLFLQKYLPTFLLLTFPLYYIGLSFDIEKLYPWVYALSSITIVAFSMYKLFISAPMDDIESMYQGDMQSSYFVLPHVCVVSIAAIKKPTWVNIPLSALGIIIIALMGSRGPLICITLAIVVYLVFFKQYKKPILAYTLIIMIAIALLLSLEQMMIMLYKLAESVGLSVRVFDKFLEGAFASSGSRERIKDILLEKISENPILGYGLFSDRVAAGNYAHSIAIELWHAFGIFLGSAILGSIAFILIRAFLMIEKQRYEWVCLFISLLFSGFVKLFLSGSFLDEIYLFLLLGICVRLIRSRKTNEFSILEQQKYNS